MKIWGHSCSLKKGGIEGGSAPAYGHSMVEALRTYHLKLYRRTRPGGTTGELTKRIEITASGLAQAEQIAVREHVAAINFETDFAILEGGTGFVSCWLTGYPHA